MYFCSQQGDSTYLDYMTALKSDALNSSDIVIDITRSSYKRMFLRGQVTLKLGRVSDRNFVMIRLAETARATEKRKIVHIFISSDLKPRQVTTETSHPFSVSKLVSI